VCRHFGIAPQTFYRWKRRYDRHDLRSLEARSSRPRHVRARTWSSAQVLAVLKVRTEFPRWGKYKLQVLLRRQGVVLSASRIGRILSSLKQQGRLVEPKRRHVSAQRRRSPRPYAVRKPKDYIAAAPGDLVEVDTLDVRPLPGCVLKQFTARDVVSRWDVLQVYSVATALNASRFLDELVARMPFSIRALQVDGGSEFMAEFEEACRSRGLRLFVLPPKSPKLNGHVERANRSHTEEFLELYDLPWTVSQLNVELRAWESTYNTIRPHQALGYLTPSEFLARFCAKPHPKEAVSPR
jgi:transposase InsO family protein